jgi:hypothetical protein
MLVFERVAHLSLCLVHRYAHQIQLFSLEPRSYVIGLTNVVLLDEETLETVANGGLMDLYVNYCHLAFD